MAPLVGAPVAAEHVAAAGGPSTRFKRTISVDALSDYSTTSSVVQANYYRKCMPTTIKWLQFVGLFMLLMVWFLPARIPVIMDVYDHKMFVEKSLFGVWCPAAFTFFEAVGAGGASGLQFGAVILLLDIAAWIVVGIILIRFFWNRTDDEATSTAATWWNCCAGNCFLALHYIQVIWVGVGMLIWFVMTSPFILPVRVTKDREPFPDDSMHRRMPYLGLAKHLIALSIYLSSLFIMRRWKKMVAEQDDYRTQFRNAYRRYFGDETKHGNYKGRDRKSGWLDDAGAAIAARWEALQDWAYATKDEEDGVPEKLDAETLGQEKAEDGYLNALWDMWQRDPETANLEAQNLPKNAEVEGQTIGAWFAAWGTGEKRPNLAERRRLRAELEQQKMNDNDFDAADYVEDMLNAEPEEFLTEPLRDENRHADRYVNRLRNRCRENDRMKGEDRNIGEAWEEFNGGINRFRPRTDKVVYRNGAFLDPELAAKGARRSTRAGGMEDSGMIDGGDNYEGGTMDYLWGMLGYTGRDSLQDQSPEEKQPLLADEDQEGASPDVPPPPAADVEAPPVEPQGPSFTVTGVGSAPLRTGTGGGNGADSSFGRESRSSITGSKTLRTSQTADGRPIVTLKDFAKLNRDRYDFEQMVPAVDRVAAAAAAIGHGAAADGATEANRDWGVGAVDPGPIDVFVEHRDLSRDGRTHRQRAVETANRVANAINHGGEQVEANADVLSLESYDSVGQHYNPWLISNPSHFNQWLDEKRISGYQSMHAPGDAPIGEGTYGRVWKYLDKNAANPDRAVRALKEIFVRSGAAEGFPTQALREIRVLKKVVHPNVVRLYEVCVGLNTTSSGAVVAAAGNEKEAGGGADLHEQQKKNGAGAGAAGAAAALAASQQLNLAHVYLVFEFLDHDLSGLLRHRRGFLEIAEAKCLALQMFDGLVYLHGKNILHRDLKLSNLLLSRSGELKIADFGLARYAHERDPAVAGNTMNSSGTIMGGANKQPAPHFTNRVVTLWYRAPELLLGCTQYGANVDCWAAGCVLAELLIGRPLFHVQHEQKALELIFERLGSPPKGYYTKTAKERILYPVANDGGTLANLVRMEDAAQHQSHPRIDEWLMAQHLQHRIPAAIKGRINPFSWALLQQDGKNPSDVFKQFFSLLRGLLAYDVEKRTTSEQAFNDAWFNAEAPLPCSRADLKLDMDESCHGYQKAKRSRRV
eukprot:g5619.t1